MFSRHACLKKSRKDVVLDCDVLSHFSNTGIATYVLNLLRQFGGMESRHKFHVFARRPPAELVATAQAASNITLSTNLGKSWFWKSVGNAMVTKRIGGTLFIPAHRVPLISIVPTVSVIYDLGFELFPETFHTAERHRISLATKLAARKATRIVTISECTKRELVNLYACDPSRIRVVHLGYDETVFEPSVVSARTNRLIAEKYGLREPYFLHVGVLQPRKNLVRLIDAFVQTIREEPLCKASLVIVGKNGWKYEEILRRARAEDTKGRVVILNAVPSEDLPILYKCCLALVFPSLYEGFGLPLLEAMACGTPVACSRTSSLPEIAGEAAIFFDPLSVEQISRMMIQLWKEPNLRATMIEKGIQRARNFSWNKTARETISVLDEVAD